MLIGQKPGEIDI